MGHYKEIIFCFFLCLSLTLCDKGPQIKVEPTEYNLFIKTSEEDYKDSDKELRFTGTVNITFDLINPPASEFYFSVNIVPKTEIKNVTLYGNYFLKNFFHSPVLKSFGVIYMFV